MLKSYEAIYDHGHINWLGEVPRFKKLRVVVVADDDQEITDASTVKVKNGSQLVDILRKTSIEAKSSIAEKFGDAVEWQREQRKDRVLLGRGDE